MKKVWIAIVIIVIVVGVGAYIGRHKLKSLMGMGASPTPIAMKTTVTTAPSASAMAPSDNIYLTKTDPTKGKYLTDFEGKTLYVFDKDSTGVSNCSGQCAVIWPPYTSGATTQGTFPTNIAVITRKDGIKQFTWKGKPLYYYASDQKAGDITGDGIGGIWHIVTP